MMNNFRILSLITIGLAVNVSLSAALAQAPHGNKLYEQGVNAYFAGSCSQADALLSEAIQWNPYDPRAYYFRALSLLRQGRSAEARGDMLVGATLEAQTPQRFAVGAALERVQGGHRLMLEQFRRSARRDAVVHASATEVVPLVQPLPLPQVAPNDGPDAAVLRERRIVPLEELLRPEGPRAIADEPARTVPPAPPQNPPVNVPPAAPPEAAKADPFEDDTPSQPAESPAPPAATPPAAPPIVPPQPAPAATPPAQPPAEAEENPFGG